MRAISRTTIACLFLQACLSSAAIGQSEPPRPELEPDDDVVADLNDDVVIDLTSPEDNVVLNGPLNIPYGQVIDILAKPSAADAKDEFELSVQSVDGDQLPEPIVIRGAWFKTDAKTDLKTSALRLRGYQGGEFTGTPAAIDATATEFGFEPVFIITRQLDTIGPAEKEHMEDLIDQLALEDDDTFLEQSARFVKRESSMRTEKATRELAEFGRAGWPILMQHFLDPRPAPAVQPAKGGHTVGVICMNVIRRQIIDVPASYPATRTRKTKDGVVRFSPRHTWGFHPTLKDWLVARKDKSLQSIQADALEQLITEEDRLGYPDEATKEQVRSPLVEHLSQLKAPTSLTSR